MADFSAENLDLGPLVEGTPDAIPANKWETTAPDVPVVTGLALVAGLRLVPGLEVIEC
jgi:hypothetical protein